MNDLEIKKELTGLDQGKAAQIEAVFAPMVAGLKAIESEYSSVVALDQTPAKSAAARDLRLRIAKVRIEADKVRKVQKEEYLRAGNAIQGVYNILKFAVAEKEDSLKQIEEYYENIEKEKKAKLLGERLASLQALNVDGSSLNLGEMADDVWTAYYAMAKKQYDDVLEAERLAEEARKAEEIRKAEEEARIREENARLKREAEEREEALRKERAIQEAALAEERRKADEERKALELAARKEREERESLEREARKKAEEEEARKKAAEAAPDREKFLALYSEVLRVSSEIKSKEGQSFLVHIAGEIANFGKGFFK